MDKEYRDIMLEIGTLVSKKEQIKKLIDKIEYFIIHINDERKPSLKCLRSLINGNFLYKNVNQVFKKRESNVFSLEQILDENYFPGEQK